MNLAALCDYVELKMTPNDSYHLAVFSVHVDKAFAYHFVATQLHPYRSACGIGYTSENFLEW